MGNFGRADHGIGGIGNFGIRNFDFGFIFNFGFAKKVSPTGGDLEEANKIVGRYFLSS